MNAIAPSLATLRLLVSPTALPAEGGETLPAGFPEAESPGLAGQLALVQALARPQAVTLKLRGTELSWPAELESDLVLVELADTAEDSDKPVLDAAGPGSVIDWSAVATAFARRTSPEHFLGTAEEAGRILLDEVRTAARESAKYFHGEALPLVEVSRTPDGGMDLAFLGIWLADPDSAGTSSSTLPQGRWNQLAPGAPGALLILDEAEVEGHGLREVVLSFTMLAVVFSGPVNAGLLDILTPGPTPVSHESKAKTDGTPLEVKSQKLVQEAPKIYPSGLAGQAKEAPRKVVVDIKAQRAYLFVDGKLAFDTPVSTASKGRTTPRGTFTITEKIRSGKRSTIYKSLMPYWNRLDQSAIGMHTGQLPGYPASHGCIRLPDESARFIFDNAPRGTVVQVVDALAAVPQPWTPPAAAPALVASAP